MKACYLIDGMSHLKPNLGAEITLSTDALNVFGFKIEIILSLFILFLIKKKRRHMKIGLIKNKNSNIKRTQKKNKHQSSKSMLYTKNKKKRTPEAPTKAELKGMKQKH